MSINISLDSLLTKLNIQFCSIDSIISEVGSTKSVSLDAVTSPVGALYSMVIDALVSKTYTGSVSIDSVLTDVGTKTIGLDAYILNADVFGVGESDITVEAEGELSVPYVITGSTDICLEASGSYFTSKLITGAADIAIGADGYEGVRGAADLAIEASGTVLFGKSLTGSADIGIHAQATLLVPILLSGLANIGLDADGVLSNRAVWGSGSTEIGLSSGGDLLVGAGITGAPDIELSASGEILIGWNITGSADVVAISAEGMAEAYNVEGTFDILVLNTKTNALTKYSNFGFNSFCKFKSTYLGTKGASIYKLEGSLDDTSEIDAHITTPSIDISDNIMRALIDMIIVGRSSGKIISTITWDEKYISKDVISNLRKTVGENRLPLPKGMRGRVYSFKLENVDGSDFDLSSVRLMGSNLSKKKTR